MIKSLKGQLILSLFVSGCSIYLIFSRFELNDGNRFVQIIFFFALILNIFNSGLLTQKYMHSKKSV
ncbi:hypothetical protein [Rummeliibacillus pycnus]|uniref:hypothetical protein n=1 Tax=Rummeliibacillus pycnus TaxID=101070 RepID=UPI003D2918EF